ncbi:MAG: hypothetical protein K1X28_01250 [Parachlamydiales bacterium]|nr:hypothetical protein [Parachlamydiales bacterium]
MVAALCARAQQYVQHLPENEDALLQLSEQLRNIVEPTAQERGAIEQAFENIALVYAMLADHDGVRPPDEPIAEVLLPPHPLGEQDEFDPVVQANLLQQIGQRRLPPPAPPVQGQAAAPPVQAPRRIVQLTAPAEPDFCTKILQIFTRAIEMVMAWISACISYCFRNEEQQAPAPQPPVQQPQPQVQPQQQAGPPAVQAAPQQQIVVERGVERGTLCCKHMVLRLWDHLQRNGAEDQFPGLVQAASAAAGPVNQRVEEFVIGRLGGTQVYHTELGILDLHAVNARMNAVLLTKGDEVHLLLTDSRNRREPKYYHFNPYTAQIQRFDQMAAIVAHLQEAVPVVAETPFALQAVRVRAAV